MTLRLLTRNRYAAAFASYLSPLPSRRSWHSAVRAGLLIVISLELLRAWRHSALKSKDCPSWHPSSVYIVCDLSDWSCKNGMWSHLAVSLEQSTSTKFIFNLACLYAEVHPRVFITGGHFETAEIQKYEEKLKYYDSSDVRLMFNFEPLPLMRVFDGQVLKYDFGFTTVRGFQKDAVGMYLPYLIFASFQIKKGAAKSNFQKPNHPIIPTLFGAYANSHCGVSHRTEFYNLISTQYRSLQYLNAKCGDLDEPPLGGVMNDRFNEDSFMNSLIDRYGRYKFIIVFESAILPGYMTEKLLLAKLSGSVPVYFGDTYFQQTLLNRNSFIDCTPRGKEGREDAFQSCIKDIIALDTDDALWLQMRSESLFKGTSAKLTWWPANEQNSIYNVIGDIISELHSKRQEHLCVMLRHAHHSFDAHTLSDQPAFQVSQCSAPVLNSTQAGDSVR